MSAIRVLMKIILWSGIKLGPVCNITIGVVNDHSVQNQMVCTTNPFAICKLTIYSGIFDAVIVGILILVLVIFVLIVLFVFRMHSKRVNRELRETRIELSDSQRRKSLDVSCADVKDIYDDPNLMRKSTDYESVNYEEVEDEKRYRLEPNSSIDQPEYLYMYSVK